MARRFSTQERRQQIVEAALALLATHPLDQLTTRAIAKHVGLTQPGLFRHFRSREAILVAAVDHARGSMGGVGERILSQGLAPVAALRSLMGAIIEFAAKNPGVPRLLFHDIGAQAEPDLHRSLSLLVSMQRALLATLIRAAVEGGDLPESLDAERGAEIGQAGIQGLLLQRQLDEGVGDLEQRGAALVDHWVAGLEAGQPSRIDGGSQAEDSTQAPGPAAAIATIDVRPIIKTGRDPVADILALVARLPSHGVMKLVVPFRPAPLLALLGSRGLRNRCEAHEGGLWVVEVLAGDAPEIVDLRGLEAPEPLERVLLASEELKSGESFIARLPRFPRILLPRLQERGLSWVVHEEIDGTAMLHLRRTE